jgi:FdhD protein
VSERRKIRQIKSGQDAWLEDVLVAEEPLEIYAKKKFLARLQVLPQDKEALVKGFLLTEGLLNGADQTFSIHLNQDGNKAEVVADIATEKIQEWKSRATLASGCGGALSAPYGRPVGAGGKIDLEDCQRKFDLSFRISPDEVLALARDFQTRSKLFHETGGVHSAAIASPERILSFAEDIGRHNAADKAVGLLWGPKMNFTDKILLTSGRITLEIAAKMGRLGVPIIISRAAATASAVRLAEELHMALIGFVRGRRMNIYSAPWRVEGT